VAFAAQYTSAQGEPVALNAGNVQVCYWADGGAGGSECAVAVGDTNAVDVTAEVRGATPFGAIFGGAAPELTRRALAWVGSVNAARCVEPWSIPMSIVVRIVAGDSVDRPLTQREVSFLWKTREGQPPLVLGPPSDSAPGPGMNGNWGEVIDASCQGGSSPVTHIGDVIPSTGASGESLISQIGDAITIGDTVPVVFGSSVTGPSQPVQAVMIGYFEVECFAAADGDCGEGPPGYPKGTIVGRIRPTLFTPLDSRVQLGPVPGINQRLLLVR
jgi:hypothetical protein